MISTSLEKEKKSPKTILNKKEYIDSHFNKHNQIDQPTSKDEEFDSDGNYDNSTNYRFTPTTAGKYFVYSMIFSDGSSSGGSHVQLITDIRKNGSGASYATIFIKDYTGGGDGAWNSFTTVDMNGSSDYLEVFGYIRNTGTNNFLANPQYTFFGAYKLIGV